MRLLLHRWPSSLLFYQIIALLITRSLGSGVITATIWEWSGTVCCDSGSCNSKCLYDFKICVGKVGDECVFAQKTFEIPHTIPEKIGSYISNLKPMVETFPIQMDNTSEEENIGLTMNISVRGLPNFVVFWKQKSLILKRDKEQKFNEIIPSGAKVDIALKMTCDPNYYGDDCSLFCESPASKNASNYDCTDDGPVCREGWHGDQCEKPICKNGCGRHGSCISPNQCSCLNGWHGPECSECQTREGCANGICTKIPGTCICKPNWGGINCDKIVDKCLEKPCINGGQCFSETLMDNYKCQCPDGFTGKNCETVIKTVIHKETITISDHSGFWIFAIIFMVVLGSAMAWLIFYRRRRSRTRKSTSSSNGGRAGRRPSDIEMESLEDESRIKDFRNPHHKKHVNPPPYDVKQLSAEDLSIRTSSSSSAAAAVFQQICPPPPSYEETMSSSSTSPSRTTQRDTDSNFLNDHQLQHEFRIIVNEDEENQQPPMKSAKN